MDFNFKKKYPVMDRIVNKILNLCSSLIALALTIYILDYNNIKINMEFAVDMTIAGFVMFVSTLIFGAAYVLIRELISFKRGN